MLMIWAVDKQKEKALKHGRRVNFIFRKKRLRQQYNILNGAIGKMNDMLCDSDYLRRGSRYDKIISRAC
jgi:hypothetical protein